MAVAVVEVRHNGAPVRTDLHEGMLGLKSGLNHYLQVGTVPIGMITKDDTVEMFTAFI